MAFFFFKKRKKKKILKTCLQAMMHMTPAVGQRVHKRHRLPISGLPQPSLRTGIMTTSLITRTPTTPNPTTAMRPILKTLRVCPTRIFARGGFTNPPDQ